MVKNNHFEISTKISIVSKVVLKNSACDFMLQHIPFWIIYQILLTDLVKVEYLVDKVLY